MNERNRKTNEMNAKEVPVIGWVIALCCVGCGAPDFNATNADFQNFATWTQTTAPMMGAGAMGGMLGGAHDATDPTITRRIYINSTGANSRGGSGTFAVGTVVVKQTTRGDGSVGMTLGMVKRSLDFNPQHNGWEWFVLQPDGTITDRGANLFNGLCNGCHMGVRSRDYVFTR